VYQERLRRFTRPVLLVGALKDAWVVLMHEIRHWAQIATLLRTDEFHDFLFSPVLGGEYRR